MEMQIRKFRAYLKQHVSVAPIVVFRIAFGALMFLSVCRFILKGWVYNMYIAPKLFFPYYGFEWVKPLPDYGMYIVFALLLVSSLGILLGAFYRINSLLFFILFTYVELIDKTNYLNHYYFVSLVSFMMIFIPAAGNFSFDNKIFARGEIKTVPRFYSFILQLQLFLVYFFAGVAKLNYDWLFEAQPLKTWLPAFSHYPVIGSLMEADWIAYFFAWFACAYDLLIGFFLFNKRTVNYAYVFVIIFHMATAMFFNIGMFPYIMTTVTIIFFGQEFHIGVVSFLKNLFRYRETSARNYKDVKASALGVSLLGCVFTIYFLVQVLLPFRYLLYPGKLFWTEQGYRFSWRVMLMEKAGSAFFFVKDKNSGMQTEVDNKEYLTYMQEKMMATQPDMMVDYAKFLKEEYKHKGFSDPVVNARSFVTLNGCGSREFVDPTVDLSVQTNSFLEAKNWVKSY
jgi:hypothetical protein